MLFKVNRNNYFNNSKDNAVYTPESVIEMVLYILDIYYKDRYFKYILEPNFGSGNILDKLLRYKDSIFYAVEFDKNIFNNSIKKYKDYNNITFIRDDFLLTEKIDNKIDLCVCNPPFNAFYNNNKVVKHGAWKDFLLKVFNLLSDDGIMVFILPNYWCMNSEKYIKNYIKYMPRFNFIPLPKGVFYKNSIPCQIVTFDKANTDMFLYNLYKKLYI